MDNKDNLQPVSIKDMLAQSASGQVFEEERPAEEELSAENDRSQDSHEPDKTGELEAPEKSENPQKPQKPKKSVKKKKKKRRSATKAIVFVSVVIIVSILLSGGLLIAANDIFSIFKSDMQIDIEIPQGSTTKQIADILYEEGVIGYPPIFRLFSRAKSADGTYQYGIFKLNSAMSYEEIIENLQKITSKRSDVVSITFPEGILLHDIATKLQENNVCSAKDFLEAFNNREFEFEFTKDITNNPDKFYRMEGFAFPDSYEFFVGESPISAAKRMLSHFDAKFDAKMRARTEELGYSIEDLIIFASIVQREVKNDADMKMCAGVFYNRFKNKDTYPKMQSDVTTTFLREFIKKQIKPFDEAIFQEYTMAYSTYDRDGLPVGAIGNPGLNAIEAVLYPEDNDYFFFYSDKKGVTHFAKTYNEHLKNIRNDK